MVNELRELLDIAMDREIVSETFYIAGQKKTTDPGAIELMKELAEQERHHYRWIKDFKEKNEFQPLSHGKEMADLLLSEYLIEIKITDGAGIQDVLTAAIKREQQSVGFYSGMKSIMDSQTGKQLCERLTHEELNHKRKLEILYDKVFNQEN